MRGTLLRTGLLIGTLNIAFTFASETAQSEIEPVISNGRDSDDFDPAIRDKRDQYLFGSDGTGDGELRELKALMDAIEIDLGEPTPTSSTEYWRDIDVVFESPTSADGSAKNCGMLITPAPILQARQDDSGEIAALSNSAAAASRSASAGISQAQASAAQAISSISRTASASISSASSSASSVSASASSVLSSISSRLSSVESSASSAVSLANSSASSALMAASVLIQAASGSVDAAGKSFLSAAAIATSNAQMSVLSIGAAATQLITQSQVQAQASQALAVSSTNAAIAIVVSIIGSAIITFLVFFFVIRYRKKRLVDIDSRDKYADDRRRGSGSRSSYRDSRSSVGSSRSYYRDEKRPTTRDRSKSRTRRDKGGRRDRRGSDAESERRSRYEKESSNSKTRVGSTPRSPAQSFSEYSPYPHDDVSPKTLARTKTGLSEAYPMPKTPQSPQRKLYASPLVREPEKVARKPERVDTNEARKNLISMGPPTASTTNNLSTWLRDQDERTSIFPTFTKPDPSQPLSRGGVEKPKIQIPRTSVEGEIVNYRDSISSVRTSQFPEGFIAQDHSEEAEVRNGKLRDTYVPTGVEDANRANIKKPVMVSIPAKKPLQEPQQIRDSNFPFAKSSQPTLRGPGAGIGLPSGPRASGLPTNPRASSGLPSNPKMKAVVRESVVSNAESVEFETFENLSRKGSEAGTPVVSKGFLGVPGGKSVGGTPRASQVGKAH